MIKNGLEKIKPHITDYSLIPSIKAGAVYGATSVPNPKGFPESFSIYDGRIIPDQELSDNRFSPILPPLPYGCTGETGTFDAGLQDNDLYNPEDLYESTPGKPGQGRDMRMALTTLIARGGLRQNGTFGPKRKNYFNCYAAGKIDDFDAARIALWINQNEKRGVWVGSWWYPEFATPHANGTLSDPSYNTNYASLHAHLITGWKTIDGELYLEDISWQGMSYGNKGIVYFSRAQFNRLMAQPYTGAFTETKLGANLPIPVGYQAVIDHLVYFIRQLFQV